MTGIGVVVVAPTSGPLLHRALISLHLPVSRHVPIAAVGDAAPAVDVNALVPPVLEPDEVKNLCREHLASTSELNRVST